MEYLSIFRAVGIKNLLLFDFTLFFGVPYVILTSKRGTCNEHKHSFASILSPEKV